MHTLLITGATGNIGSEIIRQFRYSPQHRVMAAVTDPERTLTEQPVELRAFDFYNLPKVRQALQGVQTVFLLRPPHIADVQQVFVPLVQAMQAEGVRHVVFLSVQGAEKNPRIPHHQIEKLLEQSGLAYTLLRPGYFMQNLTTTLRQDLVQRSEIYLPAGRALFNWIAAEDIGAAAARVLEEPERHRNRVYTLTGTQNLSFAQAARLLTEVLERPVTYRPAWLLWFVWRKWRQGAPLPLVLVMAMLHYLPRFQPEPEMTQDVELLTGHPPRTLRQFLQEHRAELDR